MGTPHSCPARLGKVRDGGPGRNEDIFLSFAHSRWFSPSLYLWVSLRLWDEAPADWPRSRARYATTKSAPLGGALIQLIREGAKQAIKQTYTAADGSFTAKIPAGRYSLRAIAQGFSEVLFESVQVNPSAEIAYRFNLEPVNSPKTLVNQRSDRDNVKWTLRSAQSQRSIFQANEGQDSTVAAVEQANDPNTEVTQTTTDERGRARVQGVAETYFATSSSPFLPDTRASTLRSPCRPLKQLI